MKKFITTTLALALVTILMGALSPAQAQTAVPPGPGLFVSNLRLSPAQPAYNQNISFYATFANTTSTVQNFSWKVYIYRADTPTHSNDETSTLLTGIPVGTGEFQTLGTFRYGPDGYQCQYFYAQVGWLDANNKITFFTTPDGTVYNKGFSVCDANIIPTAVAPAPAPASTAVPPAPGPGLFVSNLRLSPAQPAFNQDIAFYATFVNTASAEQNFNWKVYIYRADTPTHSNNETSTLLTGFPVGTGESQSLGSFSYGPTGFQCEYFYAQVGWLDANNKITFFTTPDGTVYNKGFSICDANIIPTPVPVPATVAPTAVPPPPGPGLFVTNVRLQPFETPQHNKDTTFFPTFQNTSTTVQGFMWKVYVYRADTPNVSNWETTAVQGSFAVGSAEAQALNTFRYGSTGYDCDYFFLRVGWLDANNKITFFTTPSGQLYQKGFSVCQ